MRISVIGIGMGNPDTLTIGALRAIERAQVIVGAPRLLESLPASCRGDMLSAILPNEIKALIDKRAHCKEIAVIMSGDLGFYSGAAKLLPLLADYEVECITGVTTVSYLASKLLRPWQDVKLVSAHGTDCNIIGSVLSRREVFFLTGGKITPSDIIDELVSAGLCNAEVTVGTNLSYHDESIVTGIASELKGKTFPPLSAVWVRRDEHVREHAISSGLPDEAFIRGDVPMTKSEVRAVILSKLRLEEKSTVYDIGSGTGSVAVEMALLSPNICVYAVECVPEAWELIEKNREKFFAYNLSLIKGSAPKAMEGLPAPDCAFVGGSRGNMRGILASLIDKNPKLRVVISAIAVETLGQALCDLKELGFQSIDVTQLSVSRSKAASGYHLMTGQNPVFLLSAEGGGA